MLSPRMKQDILTSWSECSGKAWRSLPKIIILSRRNQESVVWHEARIKGEGEKFWRRQKQKARKYEAI